MRRLGRCGRARRKKLLNQDVSKAELPQYVLLQKWFKKFIGTQRRKFLHTFLKPCDFTATGRGLQAMQRIRPGDTIVSIPLHFLITVDTVLSSDIGSYIKRNRQKFTPQQLLSIFLVIEAYQQEKSHWAPYIKTLPSTYSTPLYFSLEEMKLLKPQVQRKAEALRERFYRAEKYVTKFMDDNVPWLAKRFTRERFCWAWSTIDTRSVYLLTSAHSSIELEPEESNVALAPFLDLLNHRDTAKMTAWVNAETESYEIVTEDSYNKYDQVFICYGAHDNSKLLINYGFVLPHNINNICSFTFDDILSCMPAASQNKEKKIASLTEANLHRNLVCSMEGVSWSLATALKIFALPSKLLPKWKHLVQGISLGQDIDTEGQKAALLLVSNALCRAISHLDCLKSHTEVKHYDLLLQLAQDDVDILSTTLASLNKPS
ncbi:SET domain containing 4 [Plakobranchus ocellatus]|uniref:SET domain containing 4 n=1 Tax=Plakobranchus ocellatus TaxID=259542 RepID=A0AAV4C7I1_9GAST|nr:SET domain containing 4 [Plakobranchus ocellatus]